MTNSKNRLFIACFAFFHEVHEINAYRADCAYLFAQLNSTVRQVLMKLGMGILPLKTTVNADYLISCS
jgi:hypothetical protein